MTHLPSLRAIVAMILSLQPGMRREQATSYARIIQRGSVEAALVVALIEHESEWKPTAVSADQEDYGLGQIRARFIGACRQGAGPACDAVKAMLLDGPTNLRMTIAALKRNEDMCRKITNHHSARETISAYAGLSKPSKHQWCGLAFRRGRWQAMPLHPGVAEVLRLRARLSRFR